jgi:glutamyl-tRNA reductase
MVIGVNYRTAPQAMRKRFWIAENRRNEVLKRLKSAEGIEEVVVLATSCRTEFLMWESEPTLAANSVLQFLGAEHGLKLSEWEHFYRLLDECALAHVFRVMSGLDSPLRGEPEIASEVKAAWNQARSLGAAGLILNKVLEKGQDVSQAVRAASSTAVELNCRDREVDRNSDLRIAATAEAERIVAAEALALCDRLKTETVVPTIVALRHRLEEICRQELESFIEDRGPFTREQDQSFHAITAQVIQTIASSLARELKELPEKEEQERMTAAVTRLFHLEIAGMGDCRHQIGETK